MNLFDVPNLLKINSEIEEAMLSESFWDDNRKSTSLINTLNNNKSKINKFEKLKKEVSSLSNEVINLANEYDEEMYILINDEFENVSKKFEEFEKECLFDEEFDNLNAIVEIHPGAGGTESQDWADMLYRMYVRFADLNGFKVDTLDYDAAIDAGIKSVSFVVKGINAYGYLKGEKGVHRLVRISPFDTNARRHTSFASVDVVPEFVNDINIEINESDLKIDTYRASGAGGQHINKTDSAVRITHLPSKIVVSCQNQRSQIQNKEQCMIMLKAKLYQKELEEKAKQLNSIRGEQKLIEWGSQIRSYVFCPYTLVKDHRTNYETSDVSGVMDGNINEFIFAYLNERKKK